MIRLEGVGKDYRDRPGVLSGVDLRIDDGELIVVTGAGSAGKTTLCKLLAGIELPTRGCVRIGEHDVGSLSRRALPFLRQRMGLIFQDDRFIDTASALENVILPLDIAGVARRDAIRRGKAALDRLGLLPREDARPGALSGSERRRLAIARAIVGQPTLLLADAPFERLDAGDAAIVAQLVEDFRNAGCTIVLTAREAPAALQRLARRPRVAQLINGRIVQ